MRILGVDPGTKVVGIGIIEEEGGILSLVMAGAIKLDTKENVHQRMLRVQNEVTEIIRKYKPDAMAIETQFVGKNVRSALKLSGAKDVVVIAALHEGIAVTEYAPSQIKKSASGRGDAPKEFVSLVVRQMLGMTEQLKYLDISDALAVAICHAHKSSAQNLMDQMGQKLLARVVGQKP
jgi:crossover junction endodeoxyribonuclease RuvC